MGTACVEHLPLWTEEDFFGKKHEAWIVHRQPDERHEETYAKHIAVARAWFELNQDAHDVAAMQDNWDGEGSPGYAQETVEKALQFVHRTVGMLGPLPMPTLNPADRASVDLYWEDENRFLLINFPAGGGDATYYGRDRFGSTTRGTIRSDSAGRRAVQWLA